MTQDLQIENAVRQLSRSVAGRNTLKALLAWLDDDGLSLDANNQFAVRVLLDAAWGRFAGTTRDLMREAVRT